MDRRDDAEGITYQQELEKERASGKVHDEYVEEEGGKFRVPYKTVRQVVFTNLKKEQLIDTEHSARLQYRLMLLEAVLFAKVEFVTRKISVTYNPPSAESRKAMMSLQQIVDFLAKEGVSVDPRQMQEKDVDYYNEIYRAQFNPKVIREHPPYGYTLAEWRKMKPEYEAQGVVYKKKNLEKFHNWQVQYLRDHPELAERLGIKLEEEKKPTLFGRLFKKKKNEKEKGFWFHGV